jgi:hypothetical protein
VKQRLLNILKKGIYVYVSSSRTSKHNPLRNMGNLTWLIGYTNGASITTIQWEDMDPAKLKHWLIQELREAKEVKTVADLGTAMHDTKLLGYLDNDYIETLQEVCRHMKSTAEPCFPRLFFELEGCDTLHCLEFQPGTDVIMYAFHPFKWETIPDIQEKEDDEIIKAANKAVMTAYKKAKMVDHMAWSVFSPLTLKKTSLGGGGSFFPWY